MGECQFRTLEPLKSCMWQHAICNPSMAPAPWEETQESRGLLGLPAWGMQYHNRTSSTLLHKWKARSNSCRYHPTLTHEHLHACPRNPVTEDKFLCRRASLVLWTGWGMQNTSRTPWLYKFHLHAAGLWNTVFEKYHPMDTYLTPRKPSIQEKTGRSLQPLLPLRSVCVVRLKWETLSK